jgi:isopentenyl-diphosphate Delta-isomerase
MIGPATDHVILVDGNDVAVGRLDKMRAHREGRLHRAFSVFVTNRHGELLLQKRAATKYHSGGLWSNTCCSHPRPGETTDAAALRRMREEMGFVCPIQPLFRFIYRVELDRDMIEHECDYVYVGRYDGLPKPDPDEVEDWRWAAPAIIDAELEATAERYTHWFRIAWDELRARGAIG